MGMRASVRSALCSIARPDVGVVTNVNDTHIELLQKRQKRIALAKSGSSLRYRTQAFAVLNGDVPSQ